MRARHELTGSLPGRYARLLWRGMRSHPTIYTLAIGTSAVFGVATVAVSRVLGAVTDSIVVPAMAGDSAARGQLWQVAVALGLVALTLAISVAGRRIFAGMGVAHLQADHRRAVTAQYLRLPMSWHRRHPTGQLLSNASADVEAATEVFSPLPFALGVVVMIAVAAVALLATDVWLAVSALVVLPLAVIANLVFQRHMSPAITRAQQLRAEVADVAHESFEAAVLVKSLGSEQVEAVRFDERAARLRDANIRVGSVRAVFDPVIDLLPNLGTLLVLLVGAFQVAAGRLETGDVVAAAYLLTLLAVPVRAFGWVLGELPRALVGYQRIARVLDARDELPAGTQELTAPGAGVRLRLVGVSHSVQDPDGPVELLHGLDLDVAAGRTVALVGPTGAGKTTLVGLLARLADPTRGRVLLGEQDLATIRSQDATRAVALVAQSTFVFEDTVRGNVTLADPGEAGAPSDEAVWGALRVARVDDVVRALEPHGAGLDARLGERGANLSGGQRQRLALARALVRRPRLLLLDDATSAVDPGVERDILAGLRGGATGTGGTGGTDAASSAGDRPTVVLVAYRMSSVAMADEVVHLEAGRIVDRGTHDELLARDAGYRALATAYETESARRARLAADELEGEVAS